MGANAVTTVPVYVAGEVLTAADLNITNSGIPVFASTVERDAAFDGTGEKTLAEGQFAFLEDSNSTQFYDGANWVSVGVTPGMVLIAAQTIGTTVASVTVSDAFSATYDAYKIIISGGVSSAANTNISMQLGATTTGYYWALCAFATSGVVGASATNTTSMQIGESNTNIIMVNCEIINPFLALNTTFQSGAVWNTTNNNARIYGGALLNTTSYTAFTLTPSTGTLTGGTIRVYGISNS
jgi:hypothetical protein